MFKVKCRRSLCIPIIGLWRGNLWTDPSTVYRRRRKRFLYQFRCIDGLVECSRISSLCIFLIPMQIITWDSRHWFRNARSILVYSRHSVVRKHSYPPTTDCSSLFGTVLNGIVRIKKGGGSRNKVFVSRQGRMSSGWTWPTFMLKDFSPIIGFRRFLYIHWKEGEGVDESYARFQCLVFEVLHKEYSVVLG